MFNRQKDQRRRSFFLNFVLAVFLLSACGIFEGIPDEDNPLDDGQNAQQQETQIIIQDPTDDISPTVLNTRPADNEHEVEVAANIEATFDEALEQTAVTAGSMLLQDSLGQITGNVDYRNANYTALFSPSEPLALHRSYTASLTADICDVNGNYLAGDYSWNFTTRDGTWDIGTRRVIDATTANTVYYPDIAVNRAGHALIVWVEQNGSTYEVWSRHYSPNTGWNHLTQISASGISDSTQPKVALSDNGEGSALWIANDGIVYTKRFIPGAQPWEGAVLTVSKNTFGPAHDAAFGMDSAGNAMSMWVQHESGVDPNKIYTVRASRYLQGGEWSNSPAELYRSPAGERAGGVQMAINPEGDVAAVWGSSGAIYAIKYSAIEDKWKTAAEYGEPTVSRYSGPAVALDSNGNAVIVWQESYNSTPEDVANIKGSKFNAQQDRWLVEELIADLDWKPSNAQITLNSTGNGFATWISYEGVYARRYSVDTYWHETDVISSANDNPRIVIDPLGNALAIFTRYDSAYHSLYYNRYYVGESWQGVQLAETENGGHVSACVVGGDDLGRAIAAWQYGNHPDYDIISYRFE